MNETDTLLSQLRDIQPPHVSMVPAGGWWLLLAGLILLAGAATVLYRRHQSQGWQREAQQELRRIREDAVDIPVPQSLAAASRLVRRVALAARPRQEVASLHGEQWLKELDEICGKPLFVSGFGRLLEQGPYQPAPHLNTEDLDALWDVVDELIRSASNQTSKPSHRASQ